MAQPLPSQAGLGAEDSALGTPGDPGLAVSGEASTNRRGTFGHLVRRPSSLLALVWLAAVGVYAAAAPIIAGYGPNQQDLGQVLSGPSLSHLLGTDSLGRDIFSRLAYGGRVALLGALLASAVGLGLGSLLGLVSGYLRGTVDSVLSGVADILMSIPVLVILLSIAAVTSRNITILMLSVGVLLSAGVYRVFRAATLDIRQELFITAARTSGLSDFGIMRRHILPRLGSLLLIQGAVIASLALVAQLGLGFLGIDVRPPAPSWGDMFAAAQQTVYTSAWPLVPPALVIVLTVLAFSVIGDVAQQARGGRGRQVGLGARRSRSSRTAAAVDTLPSPAVQGDDHSGSSLLELRDVTVSVPVAAGGVVALVDGVSIEIRPGEIVGLVGESGAGKSVTARSILGIVAKDASVSGSIRHQGQELIGAPEAELARLRGSEIAFVGQDPMVSLSPAIRVGSQIVEAVRTHRRGVGRKEAVAISRELLEVVRISDPARVSRLYPHQISGGMAQRVVIAMALAGEPKLVIADEPTTALDVSVQMQVLELLRTLQRERGLAVLLVTHDWGVVADVCDRAIVMYAGQVVEEAPVAGIFTDPVHPYSAALRAADPHSQVPGSQLLTIPGQVPAPGSRPFGCRFADRCSHAEGVCRAAPVPLERRGPDRQARCVRADEIGPARG